MLLDTYNATEVAYKTIRLVAISQLHLSSVQIPWSTW